MINHGKDSNSRESNNKSGYEYGMVDPSRRVLDGHTKPCEECGAVTGNSMTQEAKLFAIPAVWLLKKTSLIMVLNGLTATSLKTAQESGNH